MALDELQQQQQPTAASGGSKGAGATAPASAPDAAPAFRLLVLVTTSRPEALDEGLAARLGASSCLLTVSRGSDANSAVDRKAGGYQQLGTGTEQYVVWQTAVPLGPTSP